MPDCPHRLGDRTGLICTRKDVHTTGHVYHATWADDLPRDEETQSR